MLDSLRSRLALSNLLITLAGLGVLVFVFTNVATQRSIEIKRDQLRKQSAAVATQVQKLFSQHGSGDELHRQIDFESQLLGERIIVVGLRTRRVQVVWDSKGNTPFFSDITPQLNRQAFNRGESSSYELKNPDLIVFQTAVRGTRSPGVVGAVLLVARPEDVSLSGGSLLQLVAAAAGTALLVWLLIGVYFTYSISRPLRRVIQATGEMARGNYAARVKVRGHGEIGRLGSSFNTMARQVQQSNQVLKDFLANVSHDLRTPLTMIAGFSQALVDGTARGQEAEASAEVIHQEAAKMERLVDDLLQLTRLESGLLTLDCHPTEARSFVQNVIDGLARAQVTAAGPALRNLVPGDAPLMDVDSERLERALLNLLDNAMQHTAPDGSVSVRARPIGRDWMEISVEDTGTGIPAEDLPRIFERFYRSDRGRARTHGHSGLGLAIVREIVEAHGGKVGVDSELGRGTTFRFTVPQADAVRVAAETPAAREAVRRAATR